MVYSRFEFRKNKEISALIAGRRKEAESALDEALPQWRFRWMERINVNTHPDFVGCKELPQILFYHRGKLIKRLY